MDTYALYLRLDETDRLPRDLSQDFQAAARSILSQHEPLGPAFSPRLGLWVMLFRMKRQAIESDPLEQCESIAAAADETARALLKRRLGEDAAMNLSLDLGVLPADGSSPEELEARIAAHPRGASCPLVGPRRFRDLLERRRFDIHLQPIVELGTETTVGYEALVRAHADTGVARPDHLFGAASYYGLRAELELACAEAALKDCDRLPAGRWLSVNLSPELFEAPSLLEILSSSRRASRTVFEVTEHLPIDPAVLAEHAQRLRGAGAGLAVDDAGCGYANMGLIRAANPEIVKLCITVVRRLSGGERMLESLRRVVRDIQAEGSLALAEGIETEEQAGLARRIGFDLAQGWHFGRPRPSSIVLGELESSLN